MAERASDAQLAEWRNEAEFVLTDAGFDMSPVIAAVRSERARADDAVADLAAVVAERDSALGDVAGLRADLDAAERLAEDRRLANEAVNAELERVKRGAKTLGEIVDRQCRDVLDLTGAHDLIGADGDGDWEAVWERLTGIAAERDELKARIDAVRALQWWRR